MGEIERAIQTHTVKGLNPAGQPHAVGVSQRGELYVASKVFRSELVPMLGLSAAGSAYASGDAFGPKFMVEVPVSGVISNVVFLDLDDEGIAKDFVLFSADFTATADNSAFAVSDADLLNCIGVANVDIFSNFGSNQIGTGTPALGYVAPEGRLYVQCVTRGADDIANGVVPRFFLVVQ